MCRTVLCVYPLPDTVHLMVSATDVHCCPKTITNTPMIHTVALGDMLFHYNEHTLEIYFGHTF